MSGWVAGRDGDWVDWDWQRGRVGGKKEAAGWVDSVLGLRSLARSGWFFPTSLRSLSWVASVAVRRRLTMVVV